MTRTGMDCVVRLNPASSDRHQGTSFSGSLMGMRTTFDLLHKGAASERASSTGSFQTHSRFFQDSLEKTLRLGKTEDKWRRGQQRMRWLDGVTDSIDMSSSKLRETVKTQRDTY